MFRDALSPSVNSLKFLRRPVIYCHESHPHPSLIPYTTSNVCIFNIFSRSLIISVQQITYWNTTTYITMRSDLSLSNNALGCPYGTRITFSPSALIDVNKFEIRDPFPNGLFCFVFYGSGFCFVLFFPRVTLTYDACKESTYSTLLYKS